MNLLIDIDGTIILEDKGINSSDEFFRYLNHNHISYLLTTNSIRNPALQKERLSKIGIDIDPECILNPIMAINDHLRAKSIKEAFIAGSKAEIEQIWANQNFNDPQIVILLDFERVNFTYEDLQIIYDFLQNGVPAVSASYSTYYFSRGKKILDTGAFTRLFESASGTKIPVYGKPSKEYFDIVKRKTDGNIWMIGDDYLTDIKGAKTAGLSTVLVRSGKYRPGDEDIADPDMVIDNLLDLLQVLRGI